MLKKINLQNAFDGFTETWTPVIGGDINESQIKLAKFEGEFVWHSHEHEDELFLVIDGRLRMELRDQNPVMLEPGEYLIVPKGVEHRPVAEVPSNVVLLEPKTTVNTGSAGGYRTVSDLVRI